MNAQYPFEDEMMTIPELRDRCQAWLDDPSHRPNFDSQGGERIVSQDQFDLRAMRVKMAEVRQACSAIIRNAEVARVLDEADAVAGLLRT